MWRIRNSLLLLLVLFPYAVFATYGLTQSPNLVSATPSFFTALDSASLSATGDRTVEMWVNFTTVAAGAHYLFDSRTLATGQNGYGMYYSGTDSKMHFQTDNGATGADQGVSWSPSTGTWYHVAMVFNNTGKTVDFYVNGVVQGTQLTGYTTYTDNTSKKIIGGDSGGGGTGSNLNARVSLVRNWNEARSQANISANMCNVLGATTNLNAEWTLDNVLTDNSGNSNSLTNVNVVAFAANVPATCTAAPASSPDNGTITIFE